MGKQLWKAAKDMAGSFPGTEKLRTVMEVAEKAYLAIKASVKKQWGKLVGHIVSAASAGAGMGNGSVLSNLSEKFPKITEVVKKGIDIGKQAKETIGNAVSNVKDTLGNVVGKIKDTVVTVKDMIANRFPNAEGIVGWITKLYQENPELTDQSIVMTLRDTVREQEERRAA
jgi:hypothetical protein